MRPATRGDRQAGNQFLQAIIPPTTHGTLNKFKQRHSSILLAKRFSR